MSNAPERFISPAPLPTDLQRELLVILMEECAEVSQRASKAIRFGLDEVQPGQPHSNLIRIADEMGDLTGTVKALLNTVRPVDANLFDLAAHAADRAKADKLARFLQSTNPHKENTHV